MSIEITKEVATLLIGGARAESERVTELAEFKEYWVRGMRVTSVFNFVSSINMQYYLEDINS